MVAVGTSSCSSSSCFDATSTPELVTPVALPARPVQAADEPKRHRVCGHLTAHQLGRQCRQPTGFILRPAGRSPPARATAAIRPHDTDADQIPEARAADGVQNLRQPDHRLKLELGPFSHHAVEYFAAVLLPGAVKTGKEVLSEFLV